ncbi:DUF6446 family protein [Shimia haliotis]|uniref:Histidine kinase n=1 Tax=Shimia haliotis TaxID=1280847 RepID=A0A1I4CPC7_9RHOB|nr:DUF6446 family protein [Shimia haliotis]SFK82109.1 hypothetical protein SAMN04488036_102358 [Shimia haliotis]
MTGKIIGAVIVLTALVGGVALYWLQVYGFYDTVEASGAKDDVQLTLLVTGEPEPILYENFKAIDADSSPIRYRACFTTKMSEALLTETYEMVEHAEPRNAPEWFDCFDAKEIGVALEQGEALAFMGQKEVIYGIDRLVAIMPDGRGFVWHEINECGEIAFDGDPLPAHCPAKPED